MALSRRPFLSTALAGGAAAAVGAGCTSASGSTSTAASPQDPSYVPFAGVHQTGITHPGNEYGLMAAFTVTADHATWSPRSRPSVAEMERLLEGQRYDERDPGCPALYTATVGNPPPLSVVVSVGASLFDERYGFADRKPKDLVTMPFLTNDKLDPTRSDGDVLLTLTSAHEDVNFALRQLMRATRPTLGMHWMLDGYNRRTEAGPGEAGVRNLMGFVDGTANLWPQDGAVMDRYVWVASGDTHIRLANPRTPATNGDLIFRKGISFSRGFDAGGRLDQGLAFVSYQRRISQFLNTQARLNGEPLEEYIQAQGGGFFFALPGAPDGSWLGQSLFA